MTTDNELSDLLNLALVGLKQFEEHGGFRDIPVEDVKKDYERKSNTVKAFLQDKCSINLQAPDYVTLLERYMKNIRSIVNKEERRPLNSNVPGVKLKEVGIDKDRLRTGGTREYYYIGIKLHSELRGRNQAIL